MKYITGMIVDAISEMAEMAGYEMQYQKYCGFVPKNTFEIRVCFFVMDELISFRRNNEVWER